MLALAVQLIEQGLELVVRDVARAAQHGGGRDCRRLAGTVQFIQQALEFVGRDLVDGAATVDGHRRALGDDDGFGFRLGSCGAATLAVRNCSCPSGLHSSCKSCSESAEAGLVGSRFCTWANMTLMASRACKMTSISSALRVRLPLRSMSNRFSAPWQTSTSSVRERKPAPP